jgi:hypothetical protein
MIRQNSKIVCCDAAQIPLKGELCRFGAGSAVIFGLILSAKWAGRPFGEQKPTKSHGRA